MTDLRQGYVRLPNSELSRAPGFERDLVPVSPDEELTVTLRVRRGPDAPALPDLGCAEPVKGTGRKFMPREDFAARHGAREADIKKVVDFASGNGLDVLDIHANNGIARRSVMVRGSITKLNAAFGVELSKYTAVNSADDKPNDADWYLGREGPVFVPADIVEVIKGVFGLDRRTIGEPAAAGASAATPQVLTPPQIARIYNFPKSTPAGETLGLLEFGGGYFRADIDAYFTGLQQPAPAITEVLIDGATNSPGTSEPYDKEVTLDIDVAGSVAPGAKIIVYFAPHTEQGWIDAVTMAVHDNTNKPSVISISWGAAELQRSNTLLWTRAGILALNETFQEAASLGITVLAACGDQGSWCKISDLNAHVLYPAADPGVLACGGTLSPDVSTFPHNERTWETTGGGISDLFALPDWQKTRPPLVEVPLSVNNGANNRGIPDISGYAVPGCIFIYKSGTAARQDYQAAGTSITTPLYAGLIALVNAALGNAVGFINADLYALAGAPVFRDIADNRWNGYDGAPGYVSRIGWDACTGLGVIDGAALLQALV